MDKTIVVLLLAAVIGIVGCRGAEKRELVPPVVETTPQVDTHAEDAARVARLQALVEARIEAREQRRQQARWVSDQLTDIDEHLARLEVELEERLAAKALEWNARAFQELQAIPELDSGEEK